MNSIIKEIPPPLLSEVDRVTVVWIGRLGDFLIATPALRSLRQRFPKARIVLVSGEKGQGVAKLCPGLDEILSLKNAAHPLSNLILVKRLLEPSDLLIDFNSAYSRSSAALCRLARAKIKLGFRKPKGRWAYTHEIEAPAETEHMLDRYARLARALQAPYEPRLEVKLSPADLGESEAILHKIESGAGTGSQASRRIAIHPGNFKKFDNRWPEGNFVELTNRLLRDPRWNIFYMCGPGEEAAVRGIVSKLDKKVPLLPPMKVGVAAAMISKMDLLIVNATGTAHLAAAVGTPTFSFLSKYTDTVWMPLAGPHHRVVSDSWKSCRDIPVDLAWKGLSPVLDELGNKKSVSS